MSIAMPRIRTPDIAMAFETKGAGVVALLSSRGKRLGVLGLLLILLHAEGRVNDPARSVSQHLSKVTIFTESGALKCPGAQAAQETPTAPYARYHDLPWMRVRDWCLLFKRNFFRQFQQKSDLVFMGDSITAAWTNHAPDIWEERFSQYSPLILAIPGDETQQLLWRIENGELERIKPKVLVLLIGVNNLLNGGWSAEETAAGVEAVLHAIRKKLPDTFILHMGIFPAMPSAQNPLRIKIKATNDLLAKLDLPGVSFLDIGPSFLEADESLDAKVMYDHVHPTREGYRRWAEQLVAALTKLDRR
jgi:beta-glucosidase